ncbi:MAG: hypothetical protein Ctma_1290 [Catillopecten margaritatus gill symbiont]|uniref:DUF721 domain-containing protein n=1 Tax=Catillopecten margaritatus gill symbiont TaxID=3083288 RepID=A0AAU6PHR7_9GAMM
MSKKITNLANFSPKGALGQLFVQARILNELNEQLAEYLPDAFKSLSLCTINEKTATFVTSNQALVFRAQQQSNILLAALKQVESLAEIEKVAVKVDLKE